MTKFLYCFLEFVSEKLVKTIKTQRVHAQGICVILFVVLLINLTVTVSEAREQNKNV